MGGAWTRVAVFAGLLWAAGSAPAAAQVTLEPVATGLANVTAIANAGDGRGRLFFALQGGRIRVLAPGGLLATPFLDITSLVQSGGERGLLGLAFHPLYETNGLFYVFFTDSAGALVIRRYAVSADPNVANPASGVTLLTIPHPDAANHNGGQIKFGPDGFLYIATGDGGSTPDRAQDLTSLLGKLLRIDVDGAFPYAIPPTNPFVGVAGAPGEIWALGLRNPFRFTFDRLTGDLFIGDVGAGTWEEVDFQPAGSPGGQNYGWPRMEGAHCLTPPSGCDQTGLVLPILEYSHNPGSNCAISGGYRYRGSVSPGLAGAYFFADFCSGRIWTGRQNPDGTWTSTLELDSPHQISTFGEDEAGELYVAHLASNGAVFRINGLVGPFDLDRRDDPAIYRGVTGQWIITRSLGGVSTITWGDPAQMDVPVSADFDGDGQGDIAVYRGATGQWFLLLSGGGVVIVTWGDPGQLDIPVAADFDGDGRADITVYRGATGQWFVLRSGGGVTIVTWGDPAQNDQPVPADFDGDGRADVTVYRGTTGQWFVLRSGGGVTVLTWGDPSQMDVPVAGRYDGDARADFGVYRGTTGQWFVLLSGGGAIILTWGAPPLLDVPVPADYDGDGRTDIAVYRRASGDWFVLRSSGGASIVNTGVPVAADEPVTVRRR